MEPVDALEVSKTGERMMFVFAFTIIPPIVYTLLINYLAGVESEVLTASLLINSSLTLAFIGAVIGTFGTDNFDRVSIAIGSGFMIGVAIALYMSVNNMLEIRTLEDMEVFVLPTIFTFLGAMISPRY